jgi:hypothetical protein
MIVPGGLGGRGVSRAVALLAGAGAVRWPPAMRRYRPS